MVELYFTIKTIYMIIGLLAASGYLLYKVWKWFH